MTRPYHQYTTKELKLIKQMAINGINRQDIADELVEYLNHAQKMNDLENSQLTDLYTALVLTRKINKKFLMTLEYLVLRRIHGMDTLDLVKMVFSYSQLMS